MHIKVIAAVMFAVSVIAVGLILIHDKFPENNILHDSPQWLRRSGNSTPNHSTTGYKEISFGDDVKGSALSISLEAYGKNNLHIPIRVTLPLYPQAEKSNWSNKGALIMIPAVQYLFTAEQQYVLPGRVDDLETWYEQHMKSVGYSQSAKGSSGSITGGIQLQFSTYTNQKDTNLSIDISFQSITADKVGVGYGVKYTYIPSRTDASKIPDHIVQMSIQYGKLYDKNASKKDIITKNVTDPAVIYKVVNDVNLLPLQTATRKGCLMDDGTRAVITMFDKDGKQYAINENPACFEVMVNHDSSLFDKGQLIEKDVQSIVKQQ